MGKKWAVNFSAAKSEHLMVSRKHVKINDNPLSMDGTKINRVSEHSHLGLVFTETFKWEAHINSRIEKVRLSNNMPRIVKENIYFTFIRPLIEYGCMIYDNCPAFISHSIEQVQRRAACTGTYRDTSHVSLLKELGWPTLSKR